MVEKNGNTKKILLDSHVFLDYFLRSENEKKAKELVSTVINGKAGGIVSAIALAEIKYKILKMLGHDKAENAMFLIKNAPNMIVVDVSDDIAESAADIRYKYYKKNEREMSYADAIQIATALVSECTLIVSGDPDFEGLDEIKIEVY